MSAWRRGALASARSRRAARRGAGAAGSTGPRVEISFAPAARAEPVTGMVYLAISRDNQTPPIQQTDPEGVPLFSKYVEQLQPGARGDARRRRSRPSASPSLSDIPAGEYWVQPFVNVYTRFPRADGHTVWMHMDQWEGQNWKRSPGNLYGDPVKMRIDPASTDADQARRRQGDSADHAARRHRRWSSGSRSRARS